MDNFKLGKAPPRLDNRTIKMAALFRDGEIPAAPDAYDVDHIVAGGQLDNPMFANDAWGDCVIAGRAHMTRRFECFEQTGRVLKITDDDVLNEYWKEQGWTPNPCWFKCLWRPTLSKPDNGLVMLNSLKAWRSGWTADGQLYNIYAFAKLNPLNHAEVKAAIYLLSGLYTGFALPVSAQTQAVWDVDSSPAGSPGTWGGHCVYIKAYDCDGLTCITWGAEKRMSWAFLDKYLDEAYAVVDNRDNFISNSPVDVTALEKILHQIEGG